MDSLYRYVGYTLIDVTQTGVTSFSLDKQKQRNQQRNWETIHQILSLRAQLYEFESLGMVADNLSKYSFGINYSGVHNIWKFSFAVERPDIYPAELDKYAHLKDDFAITPVILGLDESITPPMPLFYVSGPDRNVYFLTENNK